MYVTEEQRKIETEILSLAKTIRETKPGWTRNRLVDKRNRLIKKCHFLRDQNGNFIDKRHLSY